MTEPGGPFDPGLQLERTALAWRRTALASAVGSVVGMRIVPTTVGAWVLLPLVAVLALSFAVMFFAHRRYVVDHGHLTSANHHNTALSGGALPAVLAGSVVSLGLGALVFAVFH